MVLILLREMIKFPGRSALVIVIPVAKIQSQFSLKIVYPTSSTNSTHLNVASAIVVQTECEAKNVNS